MRNGFLIKGIPAVLGFGVAWLTVTLVRNEARLLFRQLELEEALAAKSKEERRRYLLGN